MINRDYKERFDEVYQTTYATLSRDDVYIEVPKGSLSEADIQLSLDDALLHTALNRAVSNQCRDDVYCDKQIVRQDYAGNCPEAKVLIEGLQAVFPDYADYDGNALGDTFVGSYTAYREPYDSAGISFYRFGEQPTEGMMLKFGTSYPNSNLLMWYGLKFNLETKAVLLKVIVRDYDGETPELPVGANGFYSIAHNEDGTSSDWVDYYAYATPKRIRQFCEDKGLSYPLPPTIHTECDVVWCWGFVFNKVTLEYGPVKAYARYNK